MTPDQLDALLAAAWQKGREDAATVCVRQSGLWATKAILHRHKMIRAKHAGSARRLVEAAREIRSIPPPTPEQLEKLAMSEELKARAAELEQLVCDWQGASGLERGGDPSTILPVDCERNVQSLMNRVAELEREVAGLQTALAVTRNSRNANKLHADALKREVAALREAIGAACEPLCSIGTMAVMFKGSPHKVVAIGMQLRAALAPRSEA